MRSACVPVSSQISFLSFPLSGGFQAEMAEARCGLVVVMSLGKTRARIFRVREMGNPTLQFPFEVGTGD